MIKENKKRTAHEKLLELGFKLDSDFSTKYYSMVIKNDDMDEVAKGNETFTRKLSINKEHYTYNSIVTLELSRILTQYMEELNENFYAFIDLDKTEYNLNELAKEIHENAVNKGWYDEERSFPEIVALCHSELSEALEEYRNNAPAYYEVEGKPEGIAIEMADVIIRILDWAASEDINIYESIMIKHNFNKNRSHRHGGKKI